MTLQHHLENLIDIQVLSIEKSLYTFDHYCGSNTKREIDKVVSSINKLLHELTKKMKGKAAEGVTKNKPYLSVGLPSHNHRQKLELTSLSNSDKDYVSSSVLSSSPLKESRNAINISSAILADYNPPNRNTDGVHDINAHYDDNGDEEKEDFDIGDEKDVDSYSLGSSNSRDSLSLRSNSPEIYR